MNTRQYTVLVTGVGAVIGYGIIKSLRQSGYPLRIIGMDIYADAVGQHWADHFERAVRADDDGYVTFLRSLIEEHRVDLVIPGIEQDVSRISMEREQFRDLGARFVVNNPGLIRVAGDKWLTHRRLVDAKMPFIRSYIEGSFEEIAEEAGLPMLMKPRRSYASKGIYLIRSKEDYDYWKLKLGDDFMVQEFVGTAEQEYTTAAFGYGDGTCSRKITFRRILSGEGATAKAVVTEEPGLSAFVDKLAALFHPEGPTNFQFRRHEGEFLLLEINPRISSSASLRTAFGFNEAKMCIEYYLEGKRPDVEAIKKGRAVRYIEDYIIYDSASI